MRIPKHCPSCNVPMALVKVRWICGDSATCGNVVKPTAAELQRRRSSWSPQYWSERFR